MKKLSLLLGIAMLLSVCSSAVMAKSADDVVGTWMVAAKDAKVQIYKKGNKFYGKIVWLTNPEDKDTNNPDSKKKNDKLIGKLMLHSFVYDDGEWEDGKIYDPGNGKTYSCIMWLDGNSKLWVKGYIGVSFIGRKELWTRVNK